MTARDTNGATPPPPRISMDAYHDARIVGPDGRPVGGNLGMLRILRNDAPAGVIDVSGDPDCWIVTIYPRSPKQRAICARVQGQAEAEHMVKTLLLTPPPQPSKEAQP